MTLGLPEIKRGWLLACLALVCALCAQGLPMAARVGASEPQTGLPLFVENAGQLDRRARFLLWGGSGAIWLAEDGIWITVVGRSSPAGAHLRLTFPGANPQARPEPFGRLATSLNYFIGDDAAAWRTDVPAWSGVRYADLYPGLDLELLGGRGRWGWRLVARPTPGRPLALGGIRLRVEGVRGLAVEGLGGAAGPTCVRVSTAAGEYALPLLQVVGPGGAPLPFAAEGPRVEGSDILAPFTSAPLAASARVADNPASLLYSTFLGAGDMDSGRGIAVDRAGNAYLIGVTRSTGFPTTPGAFDTTLAGRQEVLVAKLNAAGSALLYATFLGGTKSDYGEAIAVDAAGNAYVTGYTFSSDFPTTPGAFDRSFSSSDPGDNDTFVTKLSPAGNALLYSTFLGGRYWDQAEAIAVDGAGVAYVAGTTWSTNYPTTPGAYDTSHNDVASHYLGDVFVTKINAAGSALLYSTLLGTSGADVGHGIAIDGAGSAYITGSTNSSAFPTTAGALDTTFNGGERYGDAFVTKLNAAGSALLYSTFLGGSGEDGSYGIAVDGAGNTHITGFTRSADWPTTPGAFDVTYNGGSLGDVFVAKLNAAGAALFFSTFLGGSDVEIGHALALDWDGSVCVAGQTSSADMPTTSGAFDTSWNGSADAFLAKLDAAGSALAYSTFLGGGQGGALDIAYALALDGEGNAYVTGGTTASDYPTTAGACDTGYNGGEDAWVSKLDLPDLTPRPTLTPTITRTPTRTLTPTRTATLRPTNTPGPSPTCRAATRCKPYLPLVLRE